MTPNPRISVLVHNLNRAEYLEKCLRSIETQTHRPLEAVILDAGSTDASLNVIRASQERMKSAGIDSRLVSCRMMGVPASRNLAARHAAGDILCFIDNDARFRFDDSMAKAAHLFQAEKKVGVITFKIFSGDRSELDPFCWIYRRSTDWQNRTFRTFSFSGGGFCIDRELFMDCGGFWESLAYAREEEELSLALIDRGYSIFFFPEIQVSHYLAKKDRVAVSKRRYIELKNGILIYWRRFPFPFSLGMIAARIVVMTRKYAIKGQMKATELWAAVPDALKEWRRNRLGRVPVSFGASLKYLRLHSTKAD